MTITGLLALGAVQIFESETQELLGYAFAVAHGRGQLQRWLLFRNPKNRFEARAPSGEMAHWSLEDWQHHVPQLWRSNSYYILAQADVYEYGRTSEGATWDRIPSADRIPSPTFPDRPGTSYQLDYLDGKVLDVIQGDERGRAYVVGGIADESSIEYWSLPARYQPAGQAHVAIAPGREDARTLEQFLQQCQASWSAGSTFVITGCFNYQGESAPFAL